MERYRHSWPASTQLCDPATFFRSRYTSSRYQKKVGWVRKGSQNGCVRLVSREGMHTMSPGEGQRVDRWAGGVSHRRCGTFLFWFVFFTDCPCCEPKLLPLQARHRADLCTTFGDFWMWLYSKNAETAVNCSWQTVSVERPQLSLHRHHRRGYGVCIPV